jgi:hypothetical protein
MKWSIGEAPAFFESVHEWDDLVRRAYKAHPLLNSKFLAPLLRHFPPTNGAFATRRVGGELVGAALLKPLGTGIWETYVPSQAPLGPAVVDLAAHPDSYLGLPRSLPGAAWMIGLKYRDPQYVALGEEHPRIENARHHQTIGVSTVEAFADYWQQRDPKLRENMRKYRRRLEAAGGEFRTILEPDEIRACVDVHGQLESAGWKGQEGTAINIANEQGRFYLEMLHAFSVCGDARIYQLLVGGQVIASQLAVVGGGVMALLKTSYDESKSNLGPGRALVQFVLESAFGEPGVRSVEFCTTAGHEDLKWGEPHDIVHTNVFRSTGCRHMREAYRRARRRVA